MELTKKEIEFLRNHPDIAERMFFLSKYEEEQYAFMDYEYSHTAHYCAMTKYEVLEYSPSDQWVVIPIGEYDFTETTGCGTGYSVHSDKVYIPVSSGAKIKVKVIYQHSVHGPVNPEERIEEHVVSERGIERIKKIIASYYKEG